MMKRKSRITCLLTSLAVVVHLCCITATTPVYAEGGEEYAPTVVKAFSGGKLKAVTVSVDDGDAAGTGDIALIELFNSLGIKATFNPLSQQLDGVVDTETLKTRYAGYEIATRSRSAVYDEVSPKLFTDNIKADQAFWNGVAEGGIQGLAYAVRGSADIELSQMLESLGIEYARNGYSTKKFDMPDDFYNWSPTCFGTSGDKASLDTLAQQFASLSPTEMSLFYYWGNSNSGNFATTTSVLTAIAGKSDTWYATNIEVAQYVKAVNKLIVNVDTTTKKTTVHNPSDMTVWVRAESTIVEIPAGGMKIISAERYAEETFVDPCTAAPNNALFFKSVLEPPSTADINRGIGQASISTTYYPEEESGNNGYQRFTKTVATNSTALIEGDKHAIIYRVPTKTSTGGENKHEVSDFKITVYKHPSRTNKFRLFVSPDEKSYTEIEYVITAGTTYGATGPWVDQYYITPVINTTPQIPKGMEFFKIQFPISFEYASDAAGNAIIGNVELKHKKMSTITVNSASTDTVALAASMPQNGATNVETDQAVTLVFNKAMDTSTFNADNITIDNGAEISSITPSGDGQTCIVEFVKLKPKTTYTLTLNGVEDGNDLPLAETFFTFTTKDELAGVINDDCNDYRYVYERASTGKLDIGNRLNNGDLAFMRTEYNNSYVVYKAPIGDITSFEVETYRDQWNVKGLFSVLYSDDGETYTPGGTGETLASVNSYETIKYSGSVPAGTKYLKINFPAKTEGDVESLHQKALIGKVKLAYAQPNGVDTAVVVEDFKLLETATNGKTVTKVNNLADIKTGVATIRMGIYNNKSVSDSAQIIFGVYKDDEIYMIEYKPVDISKIGDIRYVQQQLDLPMDLTGYTVKCMVWDSMSGINPIGKMTSIDENGMQ